jgi:hypothetical protein
MEKCPEAFSDSGRERKNYGFTSELGEVRRYLRDI